MFNNEGKIVKEHWLYGTRGKVYFNVDVVEESDCSQCTHVDVCRQDVLSFCENYEFATSEYLGCDRCLHKFTRWDSKQPILCFSCKHELKKEQ